MTSIWFMAVSLAVGTDIVKHDFREGPLPEAVFSYFGAAARQYVKVDAAGLRIILPGQGPKVGNVGIVCKAPVAGDFEITASYEILNSETPKGGYGMGCSLWVVADTPTRDIATISRRILPAGGGDIYGTDRAHSTPQKKEIHETKRFGTTARRGKLRLTRTGGEVLYAALEEGDTEFQVIRQASYPDAPLKVIRLTADTGTGVGFFDVRFTGFHVRTLGAGEAPPAAPVTPAVPVRRRLWLIVGLLIAALIILIGVGMWWALWSRRTAEEEPPRPKAKQAKRPSE
jgi:hypothetical protein